jgi:hypothetical protein
MGRAHTEGAGGSRDRGQAGWSQQVADVQAQLEAMQAQQAMTAATPAAAPAAPAPAGGGVEIAGQLQQLASFEAQGILSDAESEAARAQLLCG